MRHRLAVILGVAVCAVLAGARSFMAIAEWAADADPSTLAGLGVADVVPCESTFRRTLQSLDADALDDAAGCWAQARTGPAPGRAAAGRGGWQDPARVGGRRRARPAPAGRAGPRRTASSSGRSTWRRRRTRSPCSPRFWTASTWPGRWSPRTRCTPNAATPSTWWASRGAHYVLTVKRQPAQPARPARRPCPGARSRSPTTHRDRGHGRAERRTLKITAVAAGLAFPHAAQAIQIVRRRRRPLNSKKWSTETVYAITSLTATQARPAELAGHPARPLAIEDRLHWVRDVTYDEDRSQIRTAQRPPRHGQPPQPRHHHPAANRRNQHRRRPAPPRTTTRQAPTNDHALLANDFAGALAPDRCLLPNITSPLDIDPTAARSPDTGKLG